MSLTVPQVETCLQSVLEMLKSSGINQVELGDSDWYWDVPTSDWHELEEDPSLVVGSLVDDTNELKRVAGGDIPATVLDLERLASVLKHLSVQMLDSP